MTVDPLQLDQGRIVQKEVALGAIREIPPPMTHIGLTQISPFLDVQSDDVIFSYIAPDVETLTPARAEDAESQLAQKDDTVGTGRASVIDWAEKDHYDPSDVSRYREYLRLAQLADGGGTFPLTIGNMTEDFAGKVARDTARRRRNLDNRMEWLIMTGLVEGTISYNDGKIVFNVDFGRPGGQSNQAPASGTWDNTASDPIDDLIAAQQYMYDTYGVHITRGLISLHGVRNILNSSKFFARTGVVGGDPKYAIDGWGPQAALAVVERATGITFTQYDAVYRTRAIGSTTTVNHKFMDPKKIVLLPSQEDVDLVAADSQIGFAKTLTSPHPEGLWTPGYYEWEKDTGPDPWGHDVGTGIKAFPVFPHLDLTYTMTILP